MMEESRLEQFTERYAAGMIPWDDELPPPELMALVEEQPAGQGAGSRLWLRPFRYLPGPARLGSRRCRFCRPGGAGGAERAAEAGVANRVRFHAASVAELSFLPGSYDLALDIGCMHAMSEAELISYRDGLLRLLPPGATYLLFAHLWMRTMLKMDGPRWIAEDELLALFDDGFVLQHAEYGMTQVEDRPPWRSAWFTYRRAAGDR